MDVSAGVDAAMFAWRRANVAELNRLARQRWAADGHLAGPELTVAGGRTYAAGDRIVTLAPGADGRLVTSQAGVVAAVDPARATLDLRLDDGERVRLSGAEAGADRLDYGYARTVHRSQGDTVDVSHRYFDSGGRELAYVSMSRARHESFVYVVADDVDQAEGDLVQDWSNDRRQRWAIDTGTPTTSVAELDQAPETPSRLQAVIREARLRSERDALVAAIPPDVADELHEARRQLAALEARRGDLETGGRYPHTPEERAGVALDRAGRQLEDAERRSTDRRLSRTERRTARYEIPDLRAQYDDITFTGPPSPAPTTPVSLAKSTSAMTASKTFKSAATSAATGSPAILKPSPEFSASNESSRPSTRPRRRPCSVSSASSRRPGASMAPTSASGSDGGRIADRRRPTKPHGLVRGEAAATGAVAAQP